ncbi:hypothetical protein MLD38_016916 [Melastoma candidum]|uniref:Uncharacterized protein n=1 Tax=Melastoma candidum TaxID=119954 RepID=A0ACB9QNY6_9MYRT|nr:hypothetical protein MLD38_016916 [Melastoma candidum]
MMSFRDRFYQWDKTSVQTGSPSFLPLLHRRPNRTAGRRSSAIDQSSHPYLQSNLDRGDNISMVYITSWEEFVERSVQLFRADPESTRYCMKYRHCDGKLVLKVTDDRQCLKFKTDQAQDAKKMEKLNNIFFTLMARGPDADISEAAGKEQSEAQPTKKGRGRKQ